MNRFSKTLIASTLLVGFSATVAAQDCVLPTAPIIPDGNVASKDELISAQGAYKEYELNIDGYRGCLEEKDKAIVVDAEGAAEQKAELLALDGASVDALTKVAEEFNVAVRAFKAKSN